MQIYNMEAQWRYAFGPGVSVIWDINQPAFDTFALVSLTKTRQGNSGEVALVDFRVSSASMATI